ncbi:MAG: hypothetical protein AB1679_02395 [Actinomycetota bacterium]|jgi:hypothetical protein
MGVLPLALVAVLVSSATPTSEDIQRMAEDGGAHWPPLLQP